MSTAALGQHWPYIVSEMDCRRLVMPREHQRSSVQLPESKRACVVHVVILLLAA